MSLSHFLEQVEPLEIFGRVAQAVGMVVEGYGPMTSTRLVDTFFEIQFVPLSSAAQQRGQRES